MATVDTFDDIPATVLTFVIFEPTVLMELLPDPVLTAADILPQSSAKVTKPVTLAIAS